MLVFNETAKYGVQTTFYFSFEDISDAEAPFVGTAPGTADIWVVIDGGTPANATNAMAAVGNGVYSWVATAAELAGTRVLVSVYDATASAIFKPAVMRILTKLQLGQIDVDATAIGGNTYAAVFTGVGTGGGIGATGGSGGHGILATGTAGGSGIVGACGSSGAAGIYGLGHASAGAGIYGHAQASGTHGLRGLGNTSGAGISGEGGASGPGIRGISGATSGDGILAQSQTLGNGIQCEGNGSGGYGIKATADATTEYNNFFDQRLPAEPSTAFASTDSIGRTIARVARRFYNKVTQSNTQQIQYADDNTTAVDTMTVSDTGTLQTKAKSS